MMDSPVADRVVLVIPAYRAESTVCDVVLAFRPHVDLVIIVDDGSADGTPAAVEALSDEGVVVLRHERNQGVGAAMKTGLAEALRRGADIVVKADADGQMDAAFLDDLLEPLRQRVADATKGNRWRHGRSLVSMPKVRRGGNLALGFMVRAATGAWRVFDPTNGYIAWRAEVLELIDLDDAEDGYRFEISMIGLLTAAGAVIRDVPIPARYEGESSHLSPVREAPGFAWLVYTATVRRVWRQYFVQDFTAGSLFLMGGALLCGFGVVFGAYHWRESIVSGVAATAGTVLLAALPTLMGFNLLLQALVLDIGNAPREPLTRYLRRRR